MYPEDFDGVIAGASANYWEALNVQVRVRVRRRPQQSGLEKLTACSATFPSCACPTHFSPSVLIIRLASLRIHTLNLASSSHVPLCGVLSLRICATPHASP